MSPSQNLSEDSVYFTDFLLFVSLQWDLVCDDKKLNQALATYFFLGVTFGAIVFGQLSDK